MQNDSFWPIWSTQWRALDLTLESLGCLREACYGFKPFHRARRLHFRLNTRVLAAIKSVTNFHYVSVPLAKGVGNSTFGHNHTPLE